MLRIGFVLRAACLVMLLTACAARQAAPRVTPPATSESIPQTPAASAVEAPRPHVVFFYSPLWSTCRLAVPIVRGLEREYAGQVDFTFVNVLLPQNAAYIETYGFSATPELYLLDARGQVAGFWDEIASADDLRPAFDDLLGR